VVHLGDPTRLLDGLEHNRLNSGDRGSGPTAGGHVL